MQTRLIKISLFRLLSAIFVAQALDGKSVRANSDRPPSRNISAPGEQNCTNCHSGSVNSGGGTDATAANTGSMLAGLDQTNILITRSLAGRGILTLRCLSPADRPTWFRSTSSKCPAGPGDGVVTQASHLVSHSTESRSFAYNPRDKITLHLLTNRVKLSRFLQN